MDSGACMFSLNDLPSWSGVRVQQHQPSVCVCFMFLLLHVYSKKIEDTVIKLDTLHDHKLTWLEFILGSNDQKSMSQSWKMIVQPEAKILHILIGFARWRQCMLLTGGLVLCWCFLHSSQVYYRWTSGAWVCFCTRCCVAVFRSTTRPTTWPSSIARSSWAVLRFPSGWVSTASSCCMTWCRWIHDGASQSVSSCDTHGLSRGSVLLCRGTAIVR